MGIEHDGEGSVDNLPETLDADKLKTTADLLLENNPEEIVKIYLHVFQLQKADGWPTLGELLENDDRLCFSSPEPSA